MTHSSRSTKQTQYATGYVRRQKKTSADFTGLKLIYNYLTANTISSAPTQLSVGEL
jgi:hypothetical protein